MKEVFLSEKHSLAMFPVEVVPPWLDGWSIFSQYSHVKIHEQTLQMFEFWTTLVPIC